jgi:histidinol-phosphate aminotransferase
MRQDLAEAICKHPLQVYPSYGDFPEHLAAYVGINRANVMLANGSDQAIELIIRATTAPGEYAIIPKPTFAMATQVAGAHNLKILSPEYTIEQGFPMEETLALVEKHKASFVYLCTPNNPTGTCVNTDAILRLAEACPHTVILVDECYFEYSGMTVQAHVQTHANLFITRTFSKTWGLSALRLGYVIASEENITHLLKVRGPYDVNVPAVLAVRIALEYEDDMQTYVKEVMEHAKPHVEAFLKQHGMHFWSSNGNFILFYPPENTDYYTALKQYGILVRPRQDAAGVPCIRVTIGTLKQMQHFCAVLEKIIKENHAN